MNAAIRMQQQPSQLADLIVLIDEMIAIVAEENAALAKGLPASRSIVVERKTELSILFEQWAADVSSKRVTISAKNDPLGPTFVERIGLLQVVMDENIIKIRAAIGASQKRIEAVMSAMRQRMSGSTRYGANGRLSAAAFSCASNIRA